MYTNIRKFTHIYRHEVGNTRASFKYRFGKWYLVYYNIILIRLIVICLVGSLYFECKRGVSEIDFAIKMLLCA